MLDETHPVWTQLDIPPSDVLAVSKRDLGAGPLRRVLDFTVDNSNGTNVGQECDAVFHVSSVCRGRFAVAEEDTVEQGVSPVSGSSFRHQNHDAIQMIAPSGDSALTVMDRCLSGRAGISEEFHEAQTRVPVTASRPKQWCGQSRSNVAKGPGADWGISGGVWVRHRQCGFRTRVGS